VSPRPVEDATGTALVTAQQAATAIGAPAAAAPTAPEVHEVPRRSPFGVLLSRTLPEYGGEYDVGVCDIEVPVTPRKFGTFTHKSMPDKPAGPVLDTVLFSAFYPCEKQDKPAPVVWFPAYALFVPFRMLVTDPKIDGFLKMAQRTPNFWYRAVACL
jgi:platelet-activating factor acetylhydrolase